ncbi:MAG: IS1595 family transposase [Fibrobacteraceae bacterium]|nr:IS1595 family transposase [Fibrobacteraceae bacterium]
MVKLDKVRLVSQLYGELSEQEKLAFARLIASDGLMAAVPGIQTIEDFLKDAHVGPMKCPHCGSLHVKKNGVVNGRQVFRCNECKRKFRYSTNTIFKSAKKGLGLFMDYVHCMMEQLTVRKAAARCRISKKSSFFLRHKLLDALQGMEDSVILDGIVEGDETFFSLSFKGNHREEKNFKMPRKPHKRGTAVHTRGLSKEKVCVPCVVNGDSKSFARVCCLGAPKATEMAGLLNGRVARDSVFCTDSTHAYDILAKKDGFRHVKIPSGRRVRGGYGIQRVNGYHGMLKGFMYVFHGVATKYLNNYLVWFNLSRFANGSEATIEGIWNMFNATAAYQGSKRTYMKRPIIAPAA